MVTIQPHDLAAASWEVKDYITSLLSRLATEGEMKEGLSAENAELREQLSESVRASNELREHVRASAKVLTEQSAKIAFLETMLANPPQQRSAKKKAAQPKNPA